MSPPNLLALIKPEEGVRSPEVIDDSKLLGILDTIQRFQIGEVDSVTLADTLDTIAAILRQIICGEDITGSYLKYPPQNLTGIDEQLTEIYENFSLLNTIELTATETVPQFAFVKMTGNYAMGLAQGNISANAKTIGCLLSTQKEVGELGVVAISGRKVEGILTGASYGDKYYLDPASPGGITTVPTNDGAMKEIGFALSDTDLMLDIKPTVIRHPS